MEQPIWNNHICIGSALHRGTSPILSPGTLLLHCYYSASYRIALFYSGGVAGPPNGRWNNHICIGSALHRGTSPILSPGTLLLHCYYSASYRIALFYSRGVAG